MLLDTHQTTFQAHGLQTNDLQGNGVGASSALLGVDSGGGGDRGLESAPDQSPLHQLSPEMLTQEEATSLSQAQPYNTPAHVASTPLAVNSEELGAGAQPDVSNVDPNETAFRQWQGASFPVEQFQTYTSPFGFRLSPTGGYTQEFHYGLDLAAPEGSYIRSWWSGTVVEVSDDSNCGTSVVIESGHWLHIYCHMQGHVEADGSGRYMIDRSGGLQIWEGQQVEAGQRIGRVGMTGRTTGPHLHWGLKYDGSWVDPAFVLRAMYASQQTAANPPTGQLTY
jgi:murein DD-endopeptidase MepM/ murein hydrolase activator NlpD